MSHVFLIFLQYVFFFFKNIKSYSIICLFIGFISLEEFKEACQLIGEHLDQPTEDAVDICKSMDMNKDGMVDLNEFLETFRLVQHQQSLEDIDTEEED